MKDKRIRDYIILIAAAVAVAVFFLIGTIRNYTQNVTGNLYLASTKNLYEVYSQVNQKFTTIAQMQWNQLQMTADFIMESKGNVEDVKDYLVRWNRTWKYTDFYFLQDSSAYYRLDGSMGYLMTGNAWQTLIVERKDVVFDGSMPGGQALTFFAVPVEPAEINGFSYSAVAIAYDTQALNRELGVNAYEGKAGSYMVYSNGDLAMMASDSADVGSNILYHLKKAGFIRGTYEELAENIAGHLSGQAECAINGVNYYVVYQPVDVQDWMLVAIVPVSSANSSSVDIQNLTAKMLISVFTVLALLAGAGLIGYFSYRSKMKDSELAWREMLSDIMVQNMDSVYLLLDRKNGKTKYVSPNIERLLGISPEIQAMPLERIKRIEVDQKGIWGDEVQRVPNGGSLVRDCWIRPLNGDMQPKLFQKSVYHVVRGESDMLIFEFADHSHEQRVRGQIEEALNAAREANRAKSDFLANMSHDIRTPMNAIMGMTTLIDANAESPQKVHEYIGKIRSASQHLMGLINDVLDMSKIESGKTELNSSEFCILDVLEQIEGAFQPLADARHQSLTFSMPEFAYPWMLGDSVRLTQILNNILSNAVKYTPVGGDVRVEVEECPRESLNYNKLTFRVIDNGIGMSPEYLSHIFESFTRERSSLTNKIQGTGLGMAIVKNLVDLMGGVIHVQSEQGKGSTFEVALEFKIVRPPENTKGHEEKTEKLDVSLRGMKFLCAEDNELNAEILTELLHMEGAECTFCENGQLVFEELERAKAGQYDMILMDIQMPVMNGYEATKAIREGENPIGKTIPIFAMTANAFSEDIQRSLDAGMNGHLSKPVDMEKLKQVIGTFFKEKS